MSIPPNHFDRDNRWQLPLAIKFLDPYYRSLGWDIERYPHGHQMQQLHVDVVLFRDGHQHRPRVDEKIIRGRRDGYPATKVSLETMSCSVPGREKLGWIARDEPNEATTLIICNADRPDLDPDSWCRIEMLDCVMIPFLLLRQWFWQQDHKQWEENISEQINRSISRKVPIRQIMRAIPTCRRFTIHASGAV